MKNTLAENMLRFRSKNLDSKSVNNLQKLAEQQATVASTIEKYQGIGAWLDTLMKQAGSMNPNTVYSAAIGKYVVSYEVATETSQGGGGSGTLYAYTMTPEAGWPVLRNVFVFMNSQGAQWRNNSTESWLSGGEESSEPLKRIAGDDYAIKFNSYWANIANEVQKPEIVSAKFIESCVALAKTKEGLLKQTFSLNNSIDPVSKKPYIEEKAAAFNRTQYYLKIDSKITDKTARRIYDIIKDPAVIQKLSQPATTPTTPIGG